MTTTRTKTGQFTKPEAEACCAHRTVELLAVPVNPKLLDMRSERGLSESALAKAIYVRDEWRCVTLGCRETFVPRTQHDKVLKKSKARLTEIRNLNRSLICKDKTMEAALKGAFKDARYPGTKIAVTAGRTDARTRLGYFVGGIVFVAIFLFIRNLLGA